MIEEMLAMVTLDPPACAGNSRLVPRRAGLWSRGAVLVPFAADRAKFRGFATSPAS